MFRPAHCSLSSSLSEKWKRKTHSSFFLFTATIPPSVYSLLTRKGNTSFLSGWGQTSVLLRLKITSYSAQGPSISYFKFSLRREPQEICIGVMRDRWSVFCSFLNADTGLIDPTYLELWSSCPVLLRGPRWPLNVVLVTFVVIHAGSVWRSDYNLSGGMGFLCTSSVSWWESVSSSWTLVSRSCFGVIYTWFTAASSFSHLPQLPPSTLYPTQLRVRGTIRHCQHYILGWICHRPQTPSPQPRQQVV